MTSRAKAYFNHAGLSHPDPAVIAVMRAAEQEYGDLLFSEAGIDKYYATLVECRRAIAAVMGLDGPQGISLLASATSAVQLALSALGAGLRPGDVVITSDQEHPCVTRPLTMLARRGIEIAEIAADSEAEFLDRIQVLIGRRRPGFVVMSHVSYKNGRILPVEQVGAMLAAKGTPYVVDGAQAFGHIPVDVAATRACVYIFSGHKWIGGPWGTGGLWSNAQFSSRNHFTLSSWLEQSEPSDGGRYEGGTMNYAIMAGLAAACRMWAKESSARLAGQARVRAEIQQRLDPVFESATRWKGPVAPGILAYLPPAGMKSWELARKVLDRFGVAVKPFRPPEHPDAVRISFRGSTTPEDVELLSLAMRAMKGPSL